MHMTSISQLFILSSRGIPILFQDFRGDVAPASTEIFFLTIKVWANGDAPPSFCVGGVNYLYIKKQALYFVATTRNTVSPSYVLELLTRLSNVLEDYCGTLSEKTLRENFIMCYELLDETLDYGIAQDTSTEGLLAHVYNADIQVDENASLMADAVSKCDSCKYNIRPASNLMKPRASSLYCDVVERFNVEFSSSGELLHASVEGSIQLQNYLSGDPALRLVLNDDLVISNTGQRAYGWPVLDECEFHDCVQLDEFESDRVLILQPPEGEFTAMNYRITSDVPVPFRITPFVEELSPIKIEVVLKVQAVNLKNNYDFKVAVLFPVPRHTLDVLFDIDNNASGQVAEFCESGSHVCWTIKRFVSGVELMLRAKITLTRPSPHARHDISPVRMRFAIPMHTMSGLQVHSLRLSEDGRDPKYANKRWIRYATESASYTCQL